METVETTKKPEHPHHDLIVLDAVFRYRVRPMETDFLFADGGVLTFSNWDVKGIRERFYMEEYVNVLPEDYLRSVGANNEVQEYGVRPSDVRRFVEGKKQMFEGLLLDACADIPLE